MDCRRDDEMFEAAKIAMNGQMSGDVIAHGA